MITAIEYHDLLYTRYSLYLVTNSMNIRDCSCCVIEVLKRAKVTIRTTQSC